MRRNTNAIVDQFPGLYRHDLLTQLRIANGWSERETARRADINFGTIQKIFACRATQRKVWPVAELFKVDWRDLHDLTSPLPELLNRAGLKGVLDSAR